VSVAHLRGLPLESTTHESALAGPGEVDFDLNLVDAAAAFESRRAVESSDLAKLHSSQGILKCLLTKQSLCERRDCWEVVLEGSLSKNRLACHANCSAGGSDVFFFSS